MAPGAPSVLTIRLSVTKVPFHKPANKLQILADAFPGRQTEKLSAFSFQPDFVGQADVLIFDMHAYG
jgi:hypothetical protein